MAQADIITHGTAPDGAPFQGVRIGGDRLRAEVLTLGAALRDLRLRGHEAPLVVGYANPLDYFNNPHKLGVIVGRCANRIAEARFVLEGEAHVLDRNEREVQTLHGGSDGTHVKSWAIADHGAAHVTLEIALPDGHMGFPGRLAARCTYRVDGPVLSILLEGTCDAPTYCNLTNHSYYTLDGAPDLGGHRLCVLAERYLPVDARQIPLQPVDVAGTAFDFRTARAIDAGLDHNFCLSESRRALTPAARLEAGGLAMDLATTEPGLQVYDGRALDRSGQAGLMGAPYGPRAGLALEPQAWPDAPNQVWAEQALLRPGEAYRHETRLRFAETG